MLGLHIIEERDYIKKLKMFWIAKNPSHSRGLVTFICSLHKCYNEIYSLFIWFPMDTWSYYCFFLLFNYDCDIDHGFCRFCFYQLLQSYNVYQPFILLRLFVIHNLKWILFVHCCEENTTTYRIIQGPLRMALILLIMHSLLPILDASFQPG